MHQPSKLPVRQLPCRPLAQAEIACRGTGDLKLDPIAMDRLQGLRDRLGKPPILPSAHRSPAPNRAVSGATRSNHMDGAAFDVAMANNDPAAFEAAAREVGFLGFGFYPCSRFMHGRASRTLLMSSGCLLLNGVDRGDPSGLVGVRHRQDWTEPG